MKSSYIILFLIAPVLFSCKKSVADDVPSIVNGPLNNIDGTWKMIVVKDNTTNSSTTKPSFIQGDVVITIVSNSATTGVFNGKTPSNKIMSNDFSLGPNYIISMPVLSMTKVNETTWGREFVDNIRDAQQYSFTSVGELSIRTTHKTLTFKKL